MKTNLIRMAAVGMLAIVGIPGVNGVTMHHTAPVGERRMNFGMWREAVRMAAIYQMEQAPFPCAQATQYTPCPPACPDRTPEGP